MGFDMRCERVMISQRRIGAQGQFPETRRSLVVFYYSTREQENHLAHPAATTGASSALPQVCSLASALAYISVSQLTFQIFARRARPLLLTMAPFRPASKGFLGSMGTTRSWLLGCTPAFRHSSRMSSCTSRYVQFSPPV